MDHGIVEEVVELFEEDSSSHLDEILKTVKAEHHCSETEIDSIKKKPKPCWPVNCWKQNATSTSAE